MRILVLEDSKPVQKLVQARLEKNGHMVDVVDNGQQGFRLAAGHSYDVVLSDVRMPRWDGLKFVRAMQVICPHLPIIIVSAAAKEQAIRDQLSAFTNVRAVLPKPHDFTLLSELLANIRPQSQTAVSKMARIICTLGPASRDVDVLERMIVAGMDVVRLNFSHGTYDEHEKTLLAVREAEAKWDRSIAVLQDLCGPKIRVGEMSGEGVELVTGQSIVISRDEVIGDYRRISTIVPQILDDLREGDPVLLDDGLMELRVVEPTPEGVCCEVITGGLLKSHKGMNLPATPISLPSVTEKDWKDLEWALHHSVDFVALSFVRTAEEIAEIQDYIARKGNSRLKVVAKIEKPEAVNNIHSIIETADGIMIARGDMGVELPAARVPRIQREIIQLCYHFNTPVITATQMLDSMTTNMRPTRAEVTDVSTAIETGTDCVMLSQETAVGIDPVNVVRTMASIIYEAEQTAADRPPPLPNEEPGSVLAHLATLKDIDTIMLLDPDGILFPQVSK